MLKEILNNPKHEDMVAIQNERIISLEKELMFSKAQTEGVVKYALELQHQLGQSNIKVRELEVKLESVEEKVVEPEIYEQ